MAHTAVPVIATSWWSGFVPRMPLFFPVSSQRDVTRLPSAFWNDSMTSRCRSFSFARNPSIHFLKFSRPEMVSPPVDDDEVVHDEPIRRGRIVGVPDLVPEGVHDFD